MAETRHDHRQGWTIDKGPGFLRVRLKQPLRDCMSARAVQRSIESELVEHGFQKVLFDMRHVDEHDDEVREEMWAWAEKSPHFHALALLIESELSRIRANMTAVGRKARVRAFGSPLQAEMWLVRAQPKRPGYTGLV